MEIVHVNITEVRQSKLLPSDALAFLFLALNESMFQLELLRWVGPPDQRDQWKFILFFRTGSSDTCKSICCTTSYGIYRGWENDCCPPIPILMHVVDFPGDSFEVSKKYIPLAMAISPTYKILEFKEVTLVAVPEILVTSN
jgi:hypothetical protein